MNTTKTLLVLKLRLPDPASVTCVMLIAETGTCRTAAMATLKVALAMLSKLAAV